MNGLDTILTTAEWIARARRVTCILASSTSTSTSRITVTRLTYSTTQIVLKSSLNFRGGADSVLLTIGTTTSLTICRINDAVISWATAPASSAETSVRYAVYISVRWRRLTCSSLMIWGNRNYCHNRTRWSSSKESLKMISNEQSLTIYVMTYRNKSNRHRNILRNWRVNYRPSAEMGKTYFSKSNKHHLDGCHLKKKFPKQNAEFAHLMDSTSRRMNYIHHTHWDMSAGERLRTCVSFPSVRNATPEVWKWVASWA